MLLRLSCTSRCVLSARRVVVLKAVFFVAEHSLTLTVTAKVCLLTPGNYFRHKEWQNIRKIYAGLTKHRRATGWETCCKTAQWDCHMSAELNLCYEINRSASVTWLRLKLQFNRTSVIWTGRCSSNPPVWCVMKLRLLHKNTNLQLPEHL
jgi:hypothetical protein